jgi:Ni2+-binding GTPase involved in maturation of urease and hydrogenase
MRSGSGSGSCRASIPGCFVERSLLAINVRGSPGAGKTALLESTARALEGRRMIGALAGDLATDNDARRLTAAGIRAESITTGSACLDLLPYLPDISVDRIVDALRRVMPDPKHLAVSARTGEGIAAWVTWLRDQETLVTPVHDVEAAGRVHV